VCVCMRKREIERQTEIDRDIERECRQRESMCDRGRVCVCVRGRERESVCVTETDR